ncbi:hypothetical protein D3C80_2191030 [compost metagenome]
MLTVQPALRWVFLRDYLCLCKVLQKAARKARIFATLLGAKHEKSLIYHSGNYIKETY